MSSSNDKIPPEGHKTSVVQDGRRKVHTTFPDKSEMLEEYDLRTHELLVRKIRTPSVLGGEGEWKYEIGQPSLQPATSKNGQVLIRESNENPIFLRRDTPKQFQWRIRNLPYPKHIYKISVDDESQEIVLRTSNKKYFKRFEIPDLKRKGILLKSENISFTHSHNTLIISYPKPKEIINEENKKKLELKEMESSRPAKEGDVECGQQ